MGSNANAVAAATAEDLPRFLPVEARREEEAEETLPSDDEMDPVDFLWRFVVDADLLDTEASLEEAPFETEGGEEATITPSFLAFN